MEYKIVIIPPQSIKGSFESMNMDFRAMKKGQRLIAIPVKIVKPVQCIYKPFLAAINVKRCIALSLGPSRSDAVL